MAPCVDVDTNTAGTSLTFETESRHPQLHSWGFALRAPKSQSQQPWSENDCGGLTVKRSFDPTASTKCGKHLVNRVFFSPLTVNNNLTGLRTYGYLLCNRFTIHCQNFLAGLFRHDITYSQSGRKMSVSNIHHHHLLKRYSSTWPSLSK